MLALTLPPRTSGKEKMVLRGAIARSMNLGNKYRMALTKYFGGRVRSRHEFLNLLNTMFDLNLTISELSIALERGMPLALLDKVARSKKSNRWENIKTSVLNAKKNDQYGLPEPKYNTTYDLMDFIAAAISALSLIMPTAAAEPAAASTPTKAVAQEPQSHTPDDAERKRKREDGKEVEAE